MAVEVANNTGDNDGDGDKLNGVNGNKVIGASSKIGSVAIVAGSVAAASGVVGGALPVPCCKCLRQGSIWYHDVAVSRRSLVAAR